MLMKQECVETVVLPLLTRAFQFGQKKFRFDSIRFGNLINLPFVH